METPDFEWWTVFFVLLFIAIVVIGISIVVWTGIGINEPLTLHYAIGTIAMTVVYVLLMGLGLMPFVWATVLFVVGGGLFSHAWIGASGFDIGSGITDVLRLHYVFPTLHIDCLNYESVL